MSKAILHLAENSFKLSIPNKNINNPFWCSPIFSCSKEYDPKNVEFEGEDELFMYIKYYNNHDDTTLKIIAKPSGNTYKFEISVDSNKDNYNIQQINNLDNNQSFDSKLVYQYNKHKFVLKNTTTIQNIYIRIYSDEPLYPFSDYYDSNTNFTLEASDDESFPP
jgi:hypothetical protein